MVIYCHSITPRLQYITDFVSHYYGVALTLTSSEDKYLSALDNCKINYSYHRLFAGEIWLHPHALLFETAIRPVKVECFEYAGTPAFFKSEGDLPFDILAASFYLITRYEEWGPHPKDMYGRFAHTASVAYQNNFLNLPLVNTWLENFRTLLAEKDPQLVRQKQQFTFLPTYDIDMAWSYRHKGFGRNAGAMLLQFFKGHWRRIAHRLRVLRNKAVDPYDSYEYLASLHNHWNLRPIYFFLVGLKRTRLDKNIPVKNAAFRQLISDVSKEATIGLHPSWYSGDVPQYLQKEKEALETIVQEPVARSRQHFIRFTLPQTYRRLIDAGIKEEYSMGYGSINGFRASVATPFYWFDLEHNEKTSLRVHPFCFMDANSYYIQRQTPEETEAELDHYISVVKNVNGTLCTVWHNNFLGTDPLFEGWPQLYAQFIQKAHAASL